MIFDYTKFSVEELETTKEALEKRMKFKVNNMIFDEDFASIADRLDAIFREEERRREEN